MDNRRWVGFVDVRDICKLALDKGLAPPCTRTLYSKVACLSLFKRKPDEDRQVAKATNLDASRFDPFLKMSSTASLQEVRTE